MWYFLYHQHNCISKNIAFEKKKRSRMHGYPSSVRVDRGSAFCLFTLEYLFNARTDIELLWNLTKWYYQLKNLRITCLAKLERACRPQNKQKVRAQQQNGEQRARVLILKKGPLPCIRPCFLTHEGYKKNLTHGRTEFFYRCSGV